jgi:hypothetical protein
MPIPFYNVNAEVSATNFDTQSQSVIFSAKGFMYPGGPGEILQLPLGPGSPETPSFVTVYNIVTDGVLVNTDIVSLPVAGDEMVVTGLDAATSLYGGRWRVISDPEVYTGGGFHNLDNIVFKVVRIAAT